MNEKKCFILFYLFSFGEALRWSNSGNINANIETFIPLNSASGSINLDMSLGKQIIIFKDIDLYPSGIFVNCFIAGYDESGSFSFEFCKDNDCFIVGDSKILSASPKFNMQISTETYFNGSKGLKIKMVIEKNKIDLSGNYYCKANHNSFAIRSNYIEIRDFSYWSGHLFTSIVPVQVPNTKDVTLATLPKVFSCDGGGNIANPSAPVWTKAEFIRPVFWTVCPILKPELATSTKNKMTPEKCILYSKRICDTEVMNNEICPQVLHSKYDWTTFVDHKGSLIFTALRAQSTSNIDSYALMCYTKDDTDTYKPMFSYFTTISDNFDITKGVVIDGSVITVTKKLALISPAHQEFTLYTRKVAIKDLNLMKPAFIYALFDASPEATFAWKFNGNALSSSSIRTVEKFSVKFSGEITSDMAGNYSLEVQDKSEKITMTILLKVLGPPVLVLEGCMVPLMYKWEGDSESLSCTYMQRPETISIQINSVNINLNAKHEDNVANLKSTHAYLEALSFSTAPSSYSVSDSVIMSYSVNNLTKSQGQSQYQDHTVTFMVTNALGISLMTTSIYVVPKLKTTITYAPNKDNCTDSCSSSGTRTFQCGINVEEYNKKELRVEHYWTINSHRLDEVGNDNNIFARYFSVDPKTKALTMNPIKSNNTKNDEEVKKSLNNNNIECHFNIFAANKAESTFAYLSTSDKELGSIMKIKITLDFAAINTAFVYWIIAVILGLIVLIIIIVLVTRYCMKNKGETYPLDKLERQHGYDPDKEVQDEMFKPYERQEHDPETGPGSGDERRLSITGHSVGSNDDGELDNYELDPSNFNEDGSIIGKYGANPRSRAAMA